MHATWGSRRRHKNCKLVRNASACLLIGGGVNLIMSCTGLNLQNPKLFGRIFEGQPLLLSSLLYTEDSLLSISPPPQFWNSLPSETCVASSSTSFHKWAKVELLGWAFSLHYWILLQEWGWGLGVLGVFLVCMILMIYIVCISMAFFR